MENVAKRYESGGAFGSRHEVHALAGVTFSIFPGTTFAVEKYAGIVPGLLGARDFRKNLVRADGGYGPGCRAATRHTAEYPDGISGSREFAESTNERAGTGVRAVEYSEPLRQM